MAQRAASSRHLADSRQAEDPLCRAPFEASLLDFIHFTGRKTKAQREQALPKVTQPVDRLEPKLCHQDER